MGPPIFGQNHSGRTLPRPTTLIHTISIRKNNPLVPQTLYDRTRCGSTRRQSYRLYPFKLESGDSTTVPPTLFTRSQFRTTPDRPATLIRTNSNRATPALPITVICRHYSLYLDEERCPARRDALFRSISKRTIPRSSRRPYPLDLDTEQTPSRSDANMKSKSKRETSRTFHRPYHHDLNAEPPHVCSERGETDKRVYERRRESVWWIERCRFQYSLMQTRTCRHTFRE